MNVLLDTCAVIWATSSPEDLSDSACAAIADSGNRVFLSAISCAEIACLAQAGKIMTEPHWRRWFDLATRRNGWGVLDIDLETVQEAYSLPEDFHRDPADRFIVATSRLNSMPIITADKRIRKYPHVKSIW